jgi:hypothetical protein
MTIGDKSSWGVPDFNEIADQRHNRNRRGRRQLCGERLGFLQLVDDH